MEIQSKYSSSGRISDPKNKTIKLKVDQDLHGEREREGERQSGKEREI